MRKQTWGDALWSSLGRRVRRNFWAGIWCACALSLAVVALALTLPRLVDHRGETVSVVANFDFVEIRGLAVVDVRSSEKPVRWRIALDDLARLEEPDVLDEWIAYRNFVQLNNDLEARVSRSSQLELRRTDGSSVSVRVERGALSLLGWAFWLQIATALFCAVTGELTWRLARPSAGLLGYRLAGWGVAFAAWASSLYATRSIGISAELFESAHAVNTIFGGPLFGAGLCMLLASEPRPLMKRPTLWLLGLPFTALAWGLRLPGLGPSLSGYSSILVYTVAIVALLSVQRYSLRSAVEQAIWRWLTLGVVCGIAFFVVAQALPVALGIPPLASQTMTLLGFAWLFGLLSLGASRFRLFAVARYWGRTWKWLAITAGLIGLDLAMVALLPRELGTHSWIVILAGFWVYFPFRQLLAERLNGRRRGALIQGARQLSRATTEVDLLRRFEDALGRHFETVDIDVTGAVSEVCLARDGQDLMVPWPRGDAAFVFRHKRGARSLFDQFDVEEAQAHLEFARHLLEARDAYSRGEADERQRVRRDLHDHLGASLSRLAVVSKDEKVAREIVSLTRELRQLTAALTGDPISLEGMLMELESEARSVARAHEYPLKVSLDPALQAVESNILARQRSDWLAFVRESLENAGRHAAPGAEVHLEIKRHVQGLFFRVTSQRDSDTAMQSDCREPRSGGLGLGTGLINLRRRAQLGRGAFSAEILGEDFVTTLMYPLATSDTAAPSASSIRRIAVGANAESSEWRVAR